MPSVVLLDSGIHNDNVLPRRLGVKAYVAHSLWASRGPQRGRLSVSAGFRPVEESAHQTQFEAYESAVQQWAASLQ